MTLETAIREKGKGRAIAAAALRVQCENWKIGEVRGLLRFLLPAGTLFLWVPKPA